MKITTSEDLLVPVVNFLQTNAVNYYSVQTNTQRPLILVLKDLLTDYEISGISNYLRPLNISPLQLSQLNSFKYDLKLLPILFISAQKDKQTKNKLTEINQINNIPVFIETHISNSIKQCYGCHRFYTVI